MANGIEWFRWHHGSVTDPKFQLVARKAGASLPDVLAVWAYLLESASMSAERGDFGQIDAEALDCMFDFPTTEQRTADIMAAMATRGLIEGTRIAAWDKRQPKREDETAAERKRRQREREHELQVAVTGSESRNVTQSHAEVTRGHDRVEESREDKNTQRQPSRAGSVCLVMRKAGLQDANPGHPLLLSLIEAGASDEEFRQAAEKAVGKGFAYALGVLNRQRMQASEAAKAMVKGPVETEQEKADRAGRQRVDETRRYLAERAAMPAVGPPESIRELAKRLKAG